MANNKLGLEYQADTWKMIILVLLICKKEYEKVLITDCNYIKMCQDCGYTCEFEKVLPNLIAQIAKNINGDKGNICIALNLPEWMIIFDILALADETFTEIPLEVEFETEDVHFGYPEEIEIPLGAILKDMYEKIPGIDEGNDQLKLPN